MAPHVALEQAVELARYPGAQMHAVGHVSDRHLADRHPGPQSLPHGTAHLAVKGAHSVSPRGPAHRQGRDAKGLAVVGAVNPAQSQRVLDIDVGRLQVAAGVTPHLVRRKLVVTGGNRCVRGEDIRRAHDLHGRGFAEAGPLAQRLEALKNQKRAMTLVQMSHGRCEIERGQRAHAGNSQQQLLPNANVAVPDIEAGGELAVRRAVFRRVGVQQNQRHAAHVHPPKAHGDLMAVNGHSDRHRLPVGRAHRRHREDLHVVLGKLLPLCAARVD